MIIMIVLLFLYLSIASTWNYSCNIVGAFQIHKHPDQELLPIGHTNILLRARIKPAATNIRSVSQCANRAVKKKQNTVNYRPPQGLI